MPPIQGPEIDEDAQENPKLNGIQPETPFDDAQEQDPKKRTRRRQATPLPTPKTFNLDPQAGFEYWAALRKNDRHKRATVYPYRLWPVTDVLLELPPEEQDRIRKLRAQKRRAPGAPTTNLGLESTELPFDPKNWEQEVYHRYGAGDYNFKLNDNDPGFNKTICMWTVRGLRDMDNYPPTCRPSIVVLSDPANKSYLDWARLRGINFPGDPITTQLQAEMETEMAEAKTTEMLANKVVEMAAKASQPQNDGAMAAMSGMFTNFMQVMQQQQQQFATQMDAIARRLDGIERAPAKSQGTEPMEQFKMVMDSTKSIVAAMSPPTDKREDPLITMLMRQNEQLETRRLEEFKASEARRIEEIRATEARALRELEAAEKRHQEMIALVRSSTPPASTTNGSPTVAGGLGDLKKIFRTVEELKEQLTGEKEDNSPWAIAERIGEMIVDGAKVVTGNMAAMKAGTPPPAQTTEVATVSQQQNQHAPAQQEKTEVQQEKEFALRIHAALIAALRSGQKGHVFAGQMISQFGELPYNILLAKGKDGIARILQLNPREWGELQEVGGNGRLDKFLDEFLDAPSARHVAQAIASQKTAPAQAAPRPAGPVPVNASETNQPRRPLDPETGKPVRPV